MRCISAQRLLKMAAIGLGAWWLLHRLAGLASDTASYLLSRQCRRAAMNNNNNNNSTHSMAENLTETEYMMRTFRASGKKE
jgi:hypothetical protein